MSLDEFYDSFCSPQAPMNFLKYYPMHPKDFRDVTIDKIKRESDTIEEYHINLIVAITGVPFCKQTRFNSIVRIDRSDK